jgi:hypothetical protein
VPIISFLTLFLSEPCVPSRSDPAAPAASRPVPLAFSRRLILALAALSVAAGAVAMRAPQSAASADSGTPERIAEPAVQPRIHELLATLPASTRRFNEHLTVLASDWMEGRLPGTKGMDFAMDYVEYWFKRIGLQPPATDSAAMKSYRQPFPLGGRTIFLDTKAIAEFDDGRALSFAAGKDFALTGLGSGGDATGSLVFVGYSIEGGKDGYESFGPEDDLTGRIAMMLRFEPMDDAGRSRWSNGDGWSPSAGFAGKFRALAKRKPAGVIVVNTPGADDERIRSLRLSGQRLIDGVPVIAMTADAASSIVQLADAEGRSLTDLRRIADERGGMIELNATVTIGGRIEEERILAENVVGLLPGRGALKDEIIVIGAHLDHLGYGEFGSRGGAGSLHPGADDNASGSAGMIMLAELLSADYAAVPGDTPLRSILFIAFSAEESGLNGSAHYVRTPLFPLDKHVAMFNFDMIGRMKNDRLSVSGTATGKGMAPWAQLIFDRAKANYGIEVVANKGIGGGGSDHRPFFSAGIPVLFGIIADFHDEYHTPRDTADLIDREAAMKAVQLFRELAFDMAQRPERFVFDSGGGPMRQQAMRVRLGVRTRALVDEPGLEIVDVTPGGSADKGGIKVGDRLLLWNKEPLASREDLVAKLRGLSPGDEIQAVVQRGEEQITLFITLLGPEG